MTPAWRVRLVVTCAVALGVAVGSSAIPKPVAIGAAIAVAVIASELVISRFRELHAVLGNALRAFRDRDYSLRLTARGDDEIADLKRLYNELADVVRADRSEIYQKEVLLDTILQRTPVAVVLLNPGQRVIYSNTAARELLADGRRLDGRMLAEIVLELEPPVREALASDGDAVFSLPRGDREETFQLTQRQFQLNGLSHHLLLLERLTPELRRQELSAWKNAIRLINHEINNSIAPIRSLFHSARRAQASPAHSHRIEEIHDLIEGHLNSLQTFLESYAHFARIPKPQKERARWSEVLEAVATIYPFRIEGQPAGEGTFDRMQMQQVLINLVKNAHEAGGDASEIVVSIHRAGNDSVLRILDRGRGMTEEVMRQALLPFYTTKPGGTGVGLALCNDIIEAHGGRMRVQARAGGGTDVTCWLPN